MNLRFLISLMAAAGVAHSSNYQRIDQTIAAYDAHVASLEADFAKTPANPDDKGWVRAKLRHMVEVDQYMRKFSQLPAEQSLGAEERSEFDRQFGPRFSGVDQKNTTDLKALLVHWKWFTVSEFGADADNDAWLLVQHADHDRAFQKEVLAVLEPLQARGESQSSHYAYLFDRVATSFQDPAQRSLQRYGTQGQCTGPGTWEPFPVEDPAHLDARRASVGLSSEAEYQELFKDICHESTEDMIRRFTDAAKERGPASKTP